MSTTTLPPLVATPAPAPLPTSHPDPDLNSRPFDVHDLLQHLLDSHSNSQIMTAGGHNKKPKLLEEVKLDSFLLHHAKSYEFPSSGYKKLVNVLIQERIMNRYEREREMRDRQNAMHGSVCVDILEHSILTPPLSCYVRLSLSSLPPAPGPPPVVVSIDYAY